MEDLNKDLFKFNALIKKKNRNLENALNTVSLEVEHEIKANTVLDQTTVLLNLTPRPS